MEENQQHILVDQPTLRQLPDDPLRNIFHRLPSNPSALAFVSVAFKAWRSVVLDEDNFLRPFREAHSNAPPLLGLFSDALYDELQFTPTVTSGGVNLPAPPPLFQSYGCTHGRLLLHNIHGGLLVVWDPLTGDKHTIPSPPPGFHHGLSCGAALVCDADHVNYGDCHSSPFRVVFAYSKYVPPGGWHAPMAPVHTFACVYNSETRSWGDHPAATISTGSYFHWKPSAVASNGAAVYWMTEVGEDSYVLELHLGTQRFLLRNLPEEIQDTDDFVLAPTMDGRLGLAGVMDVLVVLFSLENDAWVHRTLVWLDELLDEHEAGGDGYPDDGYELGNPMRPRAVGFSEESNSIFLKAEPGVYIINLESGQYNRVLQTDQHLSCVYPYYSFYTAAGKAVLNDVQVDQETNTIQSGGEISVLEVKSSDGGAE
ncbi:hypothetical protein ACQ4PT_016205 [Festuca glaucescens]